MRHEGAVRSAAFSPDATRVVTASGNVGGPGAARLWDAATGVPIGEPMRHGGPLLSAAFSPDGRIVTASADGTVRLWARDGAGAPLVLCQSGPIRSVAISPDARRIIIASEDKTVIWDFTAHTRSEPCL